MSGDAGATRAGGGMRGVHLLLVAASVVFCLPLFSNLDCYGRRDWDQFLFRAETPRVALLRDRQLPLWNPYVNGGTVLLAHPHCPVASPWYAVVLALGAPLGLRVQVVLFMILGSTGMAALLRSRGVAPAGCLAGGIVFMMSSHFTLHIAEGHVEWCVLGLMPWLMLCLRRSGTTLRVTVAGAALLASVLLFGSVYIVAVFVPFVTVWSVLEAIRQRSVRLPAVWLGVLVLTGLLSSVKLWPQLEFTSAHPREMVPEGYSPRGLPVMFLDPRQALLYQATRDVLTPPHLTALRTVPAAQAVPIHNHLQAMGFEWAWHEYGGYITYLGLLLAACGLIASWRGEWPLYVAGGLALVTSLGHGSAVDLWALMQRLPLYESLHVPSRFLAVVVFALAVAAGHGLGWAAGRYMAPDRRRPGLSRLVRYGIPLIIWVELTVTGWRVLGDVFVICTLESRATMSANRPADRAFSIRRQRPQFFPVMTSEVYPPLMNNTGVPYGYENMAVERGNIRTAGDAGYRGEVWLAGEPREAGEPGEAGAASQAGEATVREWTMSRVTAGVRVESETELLLNQNYSAGWRVQISGRRGTRRLRARPGAGNLVSTRVGPGDETVEFSYFPASVIRGAVVSGLTLLLCAAALVIEFRSRKTAPADAPR